MKKIFSTLVLVLIVQAFAGAQGVIFSEDFSAGISPAIWSDTGHASGGNPAAVKFVSRTDQTTGSGGHYGSAYGTIYSPTRGNGYITFDSDSLDEGAGTTLGAGPAPAPHHAELTSHAISLPTPGVRLEFYQYFVNFRAVTSVAYSTDSIHWTVDTLNRNVAMNGVTDTAHQRVSIDLSPAVTGHSSLYLRFIFDGEYYFWALDDIRVIELPQNDLAVTSFAGRSLTSEGLGLAFSSYPATQIDSVTSQAVFRNLGRSDQTNVAADITLKKDNIIAAIYTTTPPYSVVAAGAEQTDYATLPVSGEGSYTSVVLVHSDSIDYDLIDNADSFSFTVTDSVFSINTNKISPDIYYLRRNNYGLDYRMGTLFEVKHADTVTSVTTAVMGGSNGGLPPVTYTKPGAVIIATVNPVTIDSTSMTYDPPIVYTYTDTVTAAQLSTSTTLKPITMKINNASGNAVLSPGLYWVAIKGVSTPDSNIVIAATSYQQNGYSLMEDYNHPGNLSRLSPTDAAYCQLNFGHSETLLSADFTRNPGVTPLHIYQPVKFTAIAYANTSYTYHWDFYSGPSVGYTYASQDGRVVMDTFRGSDNDTINVCLTVSDGTYSAQICKQVRVVVPWGIDDLSGINNISLVPNPANSQVTISGDHVTGTMSIYIIDIIGQEIKRFGETANGSFTKTYDLSGLSDGIYMVRIQNGNSSVTKRLIISK